MLLNEINIKKNASYEGCVDSVRRICCGLVSRFCLARLSMPNGQDLENRSCRFVAVDVRSGGGMGSVFTA